MLSLNSGLTRSGKKGFCIKLKIYTKFYKFGCKVKIEIFYLKVNFVITHSNTHLESMKIYSF